MKPTLFLLAFASLVCHGLLAQRNCGTMNVHNRLLEEEPRYKSNRDNINSILQSFRREFGELKVQNAKLPVVVHVVYKTDAQKISKQQVLSQLKVLNDDFSMKNADLTSVPQPFKNIVAKETGIQFEMATIDPKGNPTDGIVYVQTTATSFGADDKVKSSATKGSNAWPRDQYLNIWVCNLSGGLLGYAQFPGGPASTDGVVVTYTAFGTMGTAKAPFDKGRTATHEVGHWLDLFHIWGDESGCTGSDQIADTPNQAGPNGQCPPFPHVSCNNGPNGDLFMNYMDYVDDACMYMFSEGQAQRMQSTILSSRSSFLITEIASVQQKAEKSKSVLLDY